MRKIVFITALMVTNAADAHCYSRWYYPYPQKCGGIYTRANDRPPVVRRVNFNPPVSTDPVYDIPLPDLSATWGGTLDSKLELELRLKALGMSNE